MKQVDETIIEDLLSKLSLEEKIQMIHGNGIFCTEGVDRLGIPPLIMSDGPMGVRNEFAMKNWTTIGTTDDYVTYLPSNSALAATWNKDLAYQTGKVLGAEARGRGKDVILAPGINIKRSPLCGRNFEYMSEDPKLIEELTIPLIEGIQESDVAACVKHFAVNNQETERLSVDTYVEERALRELYFPGFQAAINKAGSYSLMGAYNLFRGEHCSQSKFLLTQVLRDEWNYDGAVISDWGAVHNSTCAAESGLDIEMSVTSNFDDYYMANPLKQLIEDGELEEKLIDEKVRNTLRLMLRLNMLGEGQEDRKTGTYNTEEHRAVVLEGARESVVLLKNEKKRLPIQRKGLKTLAVIGQNAESIHSNGGGSAEIKALYEISPLMGLKTKLGGNVEVKYAKGYYVPINEVETAVDWQEGSLGSLEEKQLTAEEIEIINKKKEQQEVEIRVKAKQLLEEAVALAKEVEEVIIIGGLNHNHDVEGCDRQDYELPYGQDTLITEILKVNPNAVIVMVAGSPVQMSEWSNKAKAIVWSWYAGMESGTAVAEVLLGDVNPSGKLPETIPQKLEDSPAHKFGEFATTKSVTYNEGIYVGYRYYDTYNVAPEFCFGHGLSYTTFEYRDMQVLVEEGKDNDDIDLITVTVQVKVKNMGACAGAETVQIYIADKEATVQRPVHELKGFTKVYLEVGEEKQVTVTLDKASFCFYNTQQKCFQSEPGEFEIQVASSSRDIRTVKLIKLEKEYRYQ